MKDKMQDEMKEKIARLEKINNVRKWMKEFSPDEWQIDCIDPKLTFDWLINHIHQNEKWYPKIDMDTAPRETILTEAMRRMIVRIYKSGYCRWAVEEMIHDLTDWR